MKYNAVNGICYAVGYTWASFGGGHVLPLLAVGDRISDAPPPPPPPAPTFWDGKTNHVFQYLFAFCSHFYWTYPDHMVSLSTHIQIF